MFWSPSGRDIAFVAGGRLKRIAVAGGPATSLAPITGGNLGASWNRDDVIVFAQANRTPLYRVSASGGDVMPLTTLDPARENSHRFPHFLPDGDHFLFTARSDRRENNFIYVGSLSSKTITPVRAAQSDAVYAPPGYLLFVDNGALMAQPFDLRSLTVSGTPSCSNGLKSFSSTGTVTEPPRLTSISPVPGSGFAFGLARVDETPLTST